MKISVITPVYNGVKFIRETIESVLAQTGDFELEYIICDSLSDDGTAEILKEYVGTGKIQLISRKDQGPCDAINYGMNLATGDIGCWLNADDLFEPDALQKVVTAFKKAPNTQWLYGRCRIINEAGVEIRKPITWYKNLLGYFYSRNILLCENFINQPATFWRMKLWRELGGGLNSKYKAAWDYELWLKMAASSPAFHLRENLAIFRRHDGSISENYFKKQFAEEFSISTEHGNAFHCFIHRLNIWKTKFIYRLISVKKHEICDNSRGLHTFVIPAYNNSSYIEYCIKSLLQQTVKSEIIIATSTPSQYLDNIAAKYNISLKINEHGNGIASDWNFALSCASTPFCTLAHQDDIYCSDYVEKMLPAAMKDKKSGIVFCDYAELKKGELNFWAWHLTVKRLLLFPFYLKPRWKLKFVKKAILYFGCPICCPGVMFNLNNWKKNYFNAEYAINLDWDAWLRISKTNKSFIFVPNKLLEHRISAECETSKALHDDRRQNEDFEMFSRLWVYPIALLLSKLYKLCYKQSKEAE